MGKGTPRTKELMDLLSVGEGDQAYLLEPTQGDRYYLFQPGKPEPVTWISNRILWELIHASNTSFKKEIVMPGGEFPDGRVNKDGIRYCYRYRDDPPPADVNWPNGTPQQQARFNKLLN